MKVVVSRTILEQNNACKAYLRSPEWSESEQALVYSDWSNTVDRLLSSAAGSSYLTFLVTHKLVPMTLAELDAARAERGLLRFGDGSDLEKASALDQAKQKLRSLKREAR